MDLNLLNFAFVVVAKVHNPSIINPDFLERRKIVPDGFTVVETITSPPLALVKYNNGIEILVQADRLQIALECKGEMPTEPHIPEIVQEYTRTLEHINYTSVGINFLGQAPLKNPGQWIKGAFLKESNLVEYGDPRKWAEVKLSEELGDCILHLTITGVPDTPMGQAVQVSANFDHKITGEYSTNVDVRDAVGSWRDKYKLYQEACEKILSMEG